VAGAPDLPGVVAAFNAPGARHVVIGGFAVIAHEHVRATEDCALMIPDDEPNDRRVLDAARALGGRVGGRDVTAEDLASRAHVRLDCGDHGMVDLLREGVPPLDFESVESAAIRAEVRGVPISFAGLETIVALKRLADRPHDRQDLEALEAIHGPLPIQPLPGLDEPR
jgi:hypothetical protein